MVASPPCRTPHGPSEGLSSPPTRLNRCQGSITRFLFHENYVIITTTLSTVLSDVSVCKHRAEGAQKCGPRYHIAIGCSCERPGWSSCLQSHVTRIRLALSGSQLHATCWLLSSRYTSGARSPHWESQNSRE